MQHEKSKIKIQCNMKIHFHYFMMKELNSVCHRKRQLMFTVSRLKMAVDILNMQTTGRERNIGARAGSPPHEPGSHFPATMSEDGGSVCSEPSKHGFLRFW
jgi:hypothetical protein